MHHRSLLLTLTFAALLATTALSQWGGGGGGGGDGGDGGGMGGMPGGAGGMPGGGMPGGMGGMPGGMPGGMGGMPGGMGGMPGGMDGMPDFGEGQNMGDPYSDGENLGDVPKGFGMPDMAGGGMPGEENNEQEKESAKGFVPTGRAGFEAPKGFRKGPTMEDIRQMQKNLGGAVDDKGNFRSSGGGGSFSSYDDMEDTVEEDDEENEDSYDWRAREKKARQEERRAKGQSSENAEEDSQAHLDKCLKQVARYCSFRVMQENFAMFVDCVASMKTRVKKDCEEWAESHEGCRADLKKNCNAMTPPETTECLMRSRNKLSEGCVNSQFYVAMEEGFEEFRDRMKDSKKAKVPGKDGTDDSEFIHSEQPRGEDADDLGEPEVMEGSSEEL